MNGNSEKGAQNPGTATGLSMTAEQQYCLSALLPKESGNGRHSLLVSPPGGGKTWLLHHLVAATQVDHPAARIMIVAGDGTGAGYWAEQSAGQIRPILNTADLRDLQDELTGHARWPESGCFVVPLWFMRQPGLIQGLSEAPWDLFVVDGLEEDDSKAFTRDLDILAQSIPLKPGGSLVVSLRTDQLAGRSEHLTRWERFELARSFAGSILFREVIYERSAQEREIGELIGKLASHPAMGVPRDLQRGRRVPAKQLEWAWSRGVLPTASFLRLLKIPPAIRGDNRPEEAFELPTDCLELIGEILWLLDDLGDDPKLAAMQHQLDGLRERTREVRVVILTSYLATLDYLACALEDVFPSVFRLSGELSPEDRKRVLHAFEEKGGYLICTHAFLDAIQTLGIEGVDLAIVYEEPASTNASWASLIYPALTSPSSRPEIWVLRPSEDSSYLGVVETSLRRWMQVEKTINQPNS